MNLPFVVHPDAERALNRLVDDPAHAVILAGETGIGKTHIASHVAGELLGGTLMNNPYYHEIVPLKNTITIDQIRELIRFFQLKVPGKARVQRVAVIQDADTMGTEAQNALLKILEEPPAGSVLLLTSSHVLGLLPTIRSRAQLIALPDPTAEQISAFFQSKGYEAVHITKLLLRYGANIAAVERSLTGERDDTDTALELVKTALGSSSFERLLLIDGLVKQKDQALAFTTTLASVASASLQAAATKRASVVRWQHILEAADTAQEALERSGNVKLVLTELMLAL